MKSHNLYILNTNIKYSEYDSFKILRCFLSLFEREKK